MLLIPIRKLLEIYVLLNLSDTVPRRERASRAWLTGGLHEDPADASSSQPPCAPQLSLAATL